MEDDLISVLIPAYNVSKYLGRCLKSVLRQTYRNLEVVVVDDGSTDDTYEIAKKFAEQDSRVVVLQKQNEGNIAKTRNFLLEHFNGKYCVWVDSDDQIKPRYVEKLHIALVSNQADMSICNFAMRMFPWPILPALRCRVDIYDNVNAVPFMIFQGLFGRFSLWNKMYRADVLKGENGVRFNTELRFGEDLFFNVEYLKRVQKVVYLREKLYVYSWRPGSEMHQKFSDKHISFVNVLLQYAENETVPVVRDTLRAWSAVSCCGFVYLANKKRYPEEIERMKHFAKHYKDYLLKNRSANCLLKLMLRLGLRTWCRQKPKLAIQETTDKK